MLKQEQISKLKSNNTFNKNSGSRAAGVVYTIPVVFHVMHSGEAIGDSTNISYAQALSGTLH